MEGSSRTSPFLYIIVGLLIGIILSFGFAVLRGKSDTEEQPTNQIQGLLLSITSPTDGDVVDKNSLTVSGSTGKDAVVVITGSVQDAIVQTSGGKFSTAVELFEGENELTVYAFETKTGESVQAPLNVLYLSEKLTSNNFLVAAIYLAQNDSTKDRIENLKEKLSTTSAEVRKEAAGLDRQHVFGSIVSINAESLTLDTTWGVKTVLLNDLTKLSAVGDAASTIKAESLKVGDRVSVIGVGKDTTAGTARYVIRSDKPAASRHALAGKVSLVGSDSLIVNYISQAEQKITLKVSSATAIQKGKDKLALSDIKTDDVIVASGTLEKDGTLVAKKILIASSKVAQPKDSTQSATPSSGQ